MKDKSYNDILNEISENIREIHKNADQTMDSRKPMHNLEDNSKFKNININEKEEKILRTFYEYSIEDTELINTIKKRKSIRDYCSKKVSFAHLFKILKYTFGYRDFETGIYGFNKFPVSFAPSTGGLACISHYIMVRNVDGLEAGLYRYNRIDNMLECISLGNCYYKIPKLLYETGFVQDSAFTIILYAEINKLIWKYGERAYRFAHIDSGVIAQNMHLIALDCNIGSCMIAGYQEKEIRKTFNLRKEEIPMLVMSFGYVKENQSEERL
ncbi:SagB/ThcOx family dehydrogenase [Mammaliicoccus lentus]|uniref:SagB/ThcOx family dehydrogenase n=1 Tax=Mammaliicoccus lentus TaxID=42858 RepID=UPI001B32B1B4|nr:SagB/ThcOx family dehydrogenase [Mammaliicoccus lentus]